MTKEKYNKLEELKEKIRVKECLTSDIKSAIMCGENKTVDMIVVTIHAHENQEGGILGKREFMYRFHENIFHDFLKTKLEYENILLNHLNEVYNAYFD
jgi:hypothetical protein